MATTLIATTCPNCTAENQTEEPGLFTCHACHQVFEVNRPKIIQAPPLPQGFKKHSAPVQSRKKRPLGDKICGDCAEIGRAKTVTQGSILIEIALWLLFLLPGLIYSIWRLTSQKKACGKCGGKMLSLNSPKGKALFAQFHS